MEIHIYDFSYVWFQICSDISNMNITPIQFYKCLADDTRLKAMLLIQKEQELCVCELAEALDVSQPKISRHLAQLRECELLLDRRQGQWVYYRINDELPSWARDVLATTLKHNSDFISESNKALCCMGNRPVRQAECC